MKKIILFTFIILLFGCKNDILKENKVSKNKEIYGCYEWKKIDTYIDSKRVDTNNSLNGFYLRLSENDFAYYCANDTNNKIKCWEYKYVIKDNKIKMTNNDNIDFFRNDSQIFKLADESVIIKEYDTNKDYFRHELKKISFEEFKIVIGDASYE